jgi:hypothetical protein
MSRPGGPKGFIGSLEMPLLAGDVIQALAELRKTTAQAIVQTVHTNFARLIRDDPWLSETYECHFHRHTSCERAC